MAVSCFTPGSLDGPCSWSGHLAEDKNIVLLPAILSLSVHIQVTKLAEISKLLTPEQLLVIPKSLSINECVILDIQSTVLK